MKTYGVCLAVVACAFAQSNSVIPRQIEDPRARTPREWIRAGVEMSPEAAFPLLVICWSPSPAGEFEAYQISGIPGYHSRARVEAFLAEFYSAAARDKSDIPSIIVCGNNWFGGAFLKASIMPLSQKFGFGALAYSSGGYFDSVRLVDERKDRLAALRRAFEASEKKEPNKALEPTPTAVTSPAAQEPRQP